MMRHHLVLRAIAALLAPAIILFAFYVQFHGDYSPGGGFQAGVIFSTAFILYGLVFGVIATRRLIPVVWLRGTIAAGVLLYALTGMAGILFGHNFLDYAPFGETAHAGRHLGIFLVELGVGLTVAAVMSAIFRAFASHAPRVSEEDW